MKTLQNIAFVIKGQNLLCSELASMALNNLPRAPNGSMVGLNAGAMRKRIRVLDILERAKAEGDIVLEDGDYTTLSSCVQDMEWAVIDSAIMSFVDHIAKAESTSHLDKKKKS